MWSTRLTRKHLNDALKTAIAKNYICRIENGYFDRNAGLTSRAAVYSVAWAEKNEYRGCQKDILLDQGKTADKPNGAKKIPVNRSKKDTRTGVKKILGKQGKKDTGIEITLINKTSINQQHGVVAVDDEIFQSYKLLTSAGITQGKASELAEKFSHEEIRNQCDWIAFRTINRSRTGLLIKAIEDRLPKPDASATGKSDAGYFVSSYYAARAGNQEEPIAQPSDKEIHEAELLIDRLTKICSEISVKQFGRHFGAFVQSSESDSSQSNKSFILAVRNFGDKFYVQLRDKRQCQLQVDYERQKKAHRDKYLPDYYQYLDKKAKEVETQLPDVYNRFLERNEARKKKSLSMLSNGKSTNEFLQTFESSALKRDRFVEYFANNAEFPVLSFWTWDRKFNGNGFEQRQVK